MLLSLLHLSFRLDVSKLRLYACLQETAWNVLKIAVRLQFYASKRLSRQYHKQLYDTQQQTNRMKTNKLQTNDQRTQSSMMHSRLYTFHKNPKQIPDACVVRPKRLHGAITTTRPTQTAHSIRNACTVNTTTTKLKVEIKSRFTSLFLWAYV